MITLPLSQGSAEWHRARARCFTASEASAMLGTSPYMTRSDLLRQKATGLTREVDAATQARFDRGHEIEAAARAFVEAEIGEDLYPVTATDDDGRLLASFDGITMDGSLIFECKTANKVLAAAIENGSLPDSHWPQVEQQLLISGARRCLFTISDGTREGTQSLEYHPRPDRRSLLIAGWRQFATDLASYQHIEETHAPVAVAIEDLPALMVQVEGRVIASNLDAFTVTAKRFIAEIKTDLTTDQHFVDADKMVKFLDEGEKRLDLVKAQAQAQAADIDALFRAIDQIKAEMRVKRLDLDKRVKARKDAIRMEIMQAAQARLTDHISSLNDRIGWHDGCPILSPAMADFAGAIKGLKTVTSLKDACETELVRAKIESSALADRIEDNKKRVEDMTLVPDFAQVCTKTQNDFVAMLVMRRQQRADADAKAKAAATQIVAAPEQATLQASAPRQDLAVLEAEPIIRAFIESREWGKGEATRVRAILIEFEKFRRAA